jgi:Carboxypeptidase regulatory-like domain/TonB dependent receptor
VGLHRLLRFSAVVLAALFLAPLPLRAQNNQTGTIRGIVTDESSAAMPGVTVTLSSAALLVPQVALTDTTGTYHFEQLPVGIYRVTFDLSGFRQYIRENIQITAGFSAELKVQMTIGALEETITVSGAGPVVDTTSTTVSTSVGAETLANQLPATRTMQEMVSIAPGVMPTAAPDLGGGNIASFVLSAYGITGQSTALIEGINTRKSNNNAETNFDYTGLEEMQVVATGGDAQTALPGVFLNAIVKSGGNVFHGRGEATWEDRSLEGNNLTPTLIAQGYATPQLLLQAKDASGNLGGPIVKDTWWFFGGAHVNTSDRTALGYVDERGNAIPAYGRLANVTGKTTYQLSHNYRAVGFWTRETQYFPDHFGSSTVPFANTRDFTEDAYEAKGELQGTITPHLVVDLFAGHHEYVATYNSQLSFANIPSVADLTTGFLNGPNMGQDRRPRKQNQVTWSLNYFPPGEMLGRHELKAGSTYMFMWTGTNEPEGLHGNYQLVFQTVGGVPGMPVQIRLFNYPITENRENLIEGGFYGQDTWRVGGRLTLNLGLRLDQFSTSIPAQNKPGDQFGPPWIAPAAGASANVFTGTAQSFPRVDTGSWWSLAPRLGVNWDIFGNGKTVVKGSFGKYNWTPGDDFAAPFNPNTTSVSTYRWAPSGCTEARALAGGCDYAAGSVNLDPNGSDFQSVLGGSNGATVKLSNSVINPNLSEQYSLNYQLFLEREVAAGVSARIGYTYIQNRNTWLQVPSLVPFSAWTIPYTVYDGGPSVASCFSTTAGRCPAVGAPITIWDMDPTYKGASFSQTMYVNRADGDRFGTIEGTVIKRPGSGKWNVLASYTATKNRQFINGNNGNNAAAPIQTNPNQLYFPLDTTWSWQGRLSGNYKLPYRFDVSGTLNVYNGLRGQRLGVFVLPNAGSITIPLEPFGATEGPVRDLLNLRLAWVLKTPRWTLRPNLEILNATNSAAPWNITFTSGPRYGFYNNIDTPRIARFGVICEF